MHSRLTLRSYGVFERQPCCIAGTIDSFSYGKKYSFLCKIISLFLSCNLAAVQNLYLPLSHGGHFESQENKKLSFCTSSLALQNLLFQHCVIKVYYMGAKRHVRVTCFNQKPGPDPKPFNPEYHFNALTISVILSHISFLAGNSIIRTSTDES